MFVSHLWRPGVLERAICKDSGPYNLGYHAFKERESKRSARRRRIGRLPLVEPHPAIANVHLQPKKLLRSNR